MNHDVSGDTSPIIRQSVECVSGKCLQRIEILRSPDWLILNSDLLHDCGPLRTQFDDVVVLAVVFFALFSRSIGFQIWQLEGYSIDMMLILF